MHNSLSLSLLSLLLYLGALPMSFCSPTPIASPPVVGRSITISRRARPQRDPAGVAAWAAANKRAVEAKYNKRASGLNLITNMDADNSYFGEIAVGTPPVAFNVILDTGSADLWLASGSSSSQASTSNQIALYDPSASSSAKVLNNTFFVEYGQGAVKGITGSDTVQFAGLQVQGQVFGLAEETSSNLLSAPLSGLMGLAFQSIASSGAKPFWQTLAETSGALDSPLMAFQLTRYTNDSKAQAEEPGGTFTIGATNSSLFTGDIDYQNIPSGAPGYWILELAGLTAQSQSITLPTGSASFAAIDTGTTGIGGPADVLASLYAAIPGSQRQNDGFYTYPCSTKVNITMRFGSSNIAWTISPEDFLLEQTSGTCVGAIFEAGSTGATPAWIIGDSFLKNVYSVFRSSPASVGFATLSSTALAMNGAGGAVPTPTFGSVTGGATATTGTDSNRTKNGSESFGGRSMATVTGMVVSIVLGLCSGLL